MKKTTVEYCDECGWEEGSHASWCTNGDQLCNECTGCRGKHAPWCEHNTKDKPVDAAPTREEDHEESVNNAYRKFLFLWVPNRITYGPTNDYADIIRAQGEALRGKDWRCGW